MNKNKCVLFYFLPLTIFSPQIWCTHFYGRRSWWTNIFTPQSILNRATHRQQLHISTSPSNDLTANRQSNTTADIDRTHWYRHDRVSSNGKGLNKRQRQWPVRCRFGNGTTLVIQRRVPAGSTRRNQMNVTDAK